MTSRGGRIPPDGRPPQAKGMGKNAKRHDLERPATPGLHGSDLQQGDVQAMEQGQRIAPAATQQPARPQAAPAQQGAPARAGSPMEIPDAIDFLGTQQGAEFNLPQAGRPIDNSRIHSWMPILRQLVTGPGSSGLFASLLIQSARQMRMAGSQAATVIDMQAGDAGIEEMLNAGIRSE